MNYAELSRQLANIIRTGTVSDLDLQNARCRVQTGNLKTSWLPWITNRAGNTRSWSAPDIGEQCIVFSPSGELAAGIVLVGLYADVSPAPSQDANQHVVTFPDGARVMYDHATSHLDITAVATVHVQASGTITIDCPQVIVNGKLTVNDLLTYTNGMRGEGGDEGTAVITGDVIADGVSLKGHTHGGVEPGGGNTGAPNQ